MLAAVVAIYLVYNRVQEYGPTITIKFKDGSGLKSGQTPLIYRGVPIGQVTAVELSEDEEYVLVAVRLRRPAASIAREGSAFWVVRPEVEIGNITGLGTVITGPEIEVVPGSGKAKSEFVGLEKAPVALGIKGRSIVLVSSRRNSLKPKSPVYYRGIEVGMVQECRLSSDAARVEIQVFINQRYANLVRSNSKFWNVSGVEVNVGLLRGVEVNMESLSSLVAGGVAFATPDNPEDVRAKEGAVFRLYDRPEKEWLEWAPKIVLPPEEEQPGSNLPGEKDKGLEKKEKRSGHASTEKKVPSQNRNIRSQYRLRNSPTRQSD